MEYNLPICQFYIILENNCQTNCGLTNSEWRSLEMPCILAECWMTRSNKLARERAWHPAWALVQMGAAPTLSSLLQNKRQTNTTHTTDTRKNKDQEKNKETYKTKYCCIEQNYWIHRVHLDQILLLRIWYSWETVMFFTEKEHFCVFWRVCGVLRWKKIKKLVKYRNRMKKMNRNRTGFMHKEDRQS